MPRQQRRRWGSMQRTSSARSGLLRQQRFSGDAPYRLGTDAVAAARWVAADGTATPRRAEVSPGSRPAPRGEGTAEHWMRMDWQQHRGKDGRDRDRLGVKLLVEFCWPRQPGKGLVALGGWPIRVRAASPRRMRGSLGEFGPRGSSQVRRRNVRAAGPWMRLHGVVWKAMAALPRVGEDSAAAQRTGSIVDAGRDRCATQRPGTERQP
jgi:hypothetical protein